VTLGAGQGMYVYTCLCLDRKKYTRMHTWSGQSIYICISTKHIHIYGYIKRKVDSLGLSELDRVGENEKIAFGSVSRR